MLYYSNTVIGNTVSNDQI